MNDSDISRPAKISLPALVPPPPANDPVETETIEPTLDLVDALCLCQRRFKEVQADCDEQKFSLTEAAYFLGLRLEHDRAALFRLIHQPLFQRRKRPLKEHHDLKPILLAVQFLMSAHTEKERKRASWIARALRSLVGDNPQPGDVREALRKYGFDNLAKAHAQARRQGKGDSVAILKFAGEAKGAVADTLAAGKAGDRVWILAEHVPANRGSLRLQLLATKPPEPDD